MQVERISLSVTIPESLAGKRLDQALAKLFPTHSRERIKSWILAGECKVGGSVWRPKDKVVGLENIEIKAALVAQTDWQAEDLPLDIVYEDEQLLVINKPANCVVHPAAGNYSGTLVNALLHHDPGLTKIPRAGVVHRLDKDTTGLLVVAKTLAAHTSLVNQLQARTMTRIYEAIVVGIFPAGGTINKPIARHPTNRKKMSVQNNGKVAITHYRVLKKFNNHTHICVQLETGRTHQIRVHMAHVHHPVVGDKTYCRRALAPLYTCNRQALHAKELALVHPTTGKQMSWQIPLPEDMLQLLDELAQYAMVNS